MTDRTISATIVAATVLWIVALVLAVLGLATDVDLGGIVVVSAAGAATLSVRSFFLSADHRERNAFEMGRDLESARIRSVR